MPRTTRTFIAIPIPAVLKARLERLQGLSATGIEGARWVEPAGFHLTLAFLGDVHDTDLSSVCVAVTEAIRGIPRFDLSIKGLGAFPDPARPRVLWAGVEGDLQTLAATQKAAFDAATSAGYRPPDDRFHPHITLARIKVGRGDAVDLGPLIAQHSGWTAGTFTAEMVVTYASGFTPDGPAYTPLGKAPLSKRGDA
jgi:RNA 2',3'-cyclic 3'-phosphodiesterase